MGRGASGLPIITIINLPECASSGVVSRCLFVCLLPLGNGVGGW